MAKIEIKDLADSIDLDQQALGAIYGGARTLARKPDPLQQLLEKPKLSLLELARAKRQLRG